MLTKLNQVGAVDEPETPRQEAERLGIMMQFQLSREAYAELRADFAAVDGNNSGTIERGEIKQMLAEGGGDPSDQQVDETLQQYDHDKDSQVSFSEYLQGLGYQQQVLSKPKPQSPKAMQRKKPVVSGSRSVSRLASTRKDQPDPTPEPSPALSPSPEPVQPAVPLATIQHELLEANSRSWLVREPIEVDMLQISGLLARAAMGAAERLHASGFVEEPESVAVDVSIVEAALIGSGMESFMTWLCFPFRDGTVLKRRISRVIKPKSKLRLSHLVAAAALFEREEPALLDGAMHGASRWIQLEYSRVSNNAAEQSDQQMQSPKFTKRDVERMTDSMMYLGDRGKSDGELGINEMETHLSSYPPFCHFVDWFTRSRQDSTHNGRYSKFSIIDCDGSGQIDTAELELSVEEYLTEIAITEPRMLGSNLELTNKNHLDRAKKRLSDRKQKVKEAKAVNKKRIEDEVFGIHKRERQIDGNLPNLRSPLGLFVPRITQGSYKNTHAEAMRSLDTICTHTEADYELQQMVQDAADWCEACPSSGTEAEVPTSHLLCRATARTLSEMAALLERQELDLAAQHVVKLRTVCKRYRAGRLVTSMIPIRAFTRQPGEKSRKFSQNDSLLLGKAVVTVGDQGDGGGTLTQNELQMYLANSPFQHFVSWLLYTRPDGSKFKKFDMMGAGELGEPELAEAAEEYLAELGEAAPSAAMLVVRQAKILAQNGNCLLAPCCRVQQLVLRCTEDCLSKWAVEVKTEIAREEQLHRAGQVHQVQAQFLKTAKAAAAPLSSINIPAALRTPLSESEILYRRKLSSRAGTPQMEPQMYTQPLRPSTTPSLSPPMNAFHQQLRPITQEGLRSPTARAQRWAGPSGWGMNAQTQWRESSASRAGERAESKAASEQAARIARKKKPKKRTPAEDVPASMRGASKMRLLCKLLDFGQSTLLDCPLSQMRRAFNAMDTDGNMMLDVEEVRMALVSIGEKPRSVSEAQLLLSALDSDGSHGGEAITYNEFVTALSKYKAFGNTAHQVIAITILGRCD